MADRQFTTRLWQCQVNRGAPVIYTSQPQGLPAAMGKWSQQWSSHLYLTGVMVYSPPSPAEEAMKGGHNCPHLHVFLFLCLIIYLILINKYSANAPCQPFPCLLIGIEPQEQTALQHPWTRAGPCDTPAQTPPAGDRCLLGGRRAVGSRQGRQRVLLLWAAVVQSLPTAKTQSINMILCSLDTHNYDTKAD